MRIQGKDTKYNEKSNRSFAEIKKKILRNAGGSHSSVKLFYNGKEIMDSVLLGAILKQNDLVMIGMLKK